MKLIPELIIAPNSGKEDAKAALRQIFAPEKKEGAKATAEHLARVYPGTEIMPVSSGRWALYLLLSSMPKGSSVLLQGFTCCSVPGPVIWAGLKPVYVDIKRDDFTMDPADLEKKIPAGASCVIVQHTFGYRPDMERILAIARGKNLAVIEDMAHVMPEGQGNYISLKSDAAIFSFGRDKAVSGVFGGAAVVRSRDTFKKSIEMYASLKVPKRSWTTRQLLYLPLMVYVVRPLYNFLALGRLLLILFQRVGLVSKVISAREKKCDMPSIPFARLSSRMDAVIAVQFKGLKHAKRLRSYFVRHYHANIDSSAVEKPKATDLPLIRYPLITDQMEEAVEALKSWHIYPGTWYEVIAPRDTDAEACGYVKGSCPVAESVEGKMINLPTNIFAAGNPMWCAAKTFRQSEERMDDVDY